MPIQITNEQLEIVNDILHAYLQEGHAWAFGSRVLQNNVEQYSDLDILVRENGPISLLKLFYLSDAFGESNLPFKVDLIDWHRTSEEFRQDITTTAIQFF